MYIFAFNLYAQINLFIKHIFTNKFITIPYYIYTDRWSAPRCLVVILVPGGGPRGGPGVLGGDWWLPSVECSSVLLGAWWWLVSSWCRWHICKQHPGGHATRLLSAAGSLASESKFRGEV